MTIAIVQSKSINGAWSGSFASDVTATDTVFLYGFQYSSSGAAMSSSAPEFNGGSVSGASKLLDGQNSGSTAVYGTIWMLPDLAGGAASVSLANSGGTVDGNVGMVALEVSGLGASPALDSGSPNPETGNGTSGAIVSGDTGALVASGAVIVGLGVAYGDNPGTPASPWTDLQPSSFCTAIWQVVTSSGGSYEFSGVANGSPGWFAGVAAVKGASGTAHTATAALTVTPSFSAPRVRGKYRTASLTVTPSFSAAPSKGGVAHTATAALTVTPSFSAPRQRGKYRTGSLTVTPSFDAARARGHYRTGALEVIPVFAAVRIRGHYRSAALTVTPSFSAIPSGGAFAPPVFIYPAYWTAAWVQADTRVTVSPAGAQTATVTSAVLGESAATLYPPGPAVIYPSP